MRDHGSERPVVTGPITEGEIERAERARALMREASAKLRARDRMRADPDPEPPLILGVEPSRVEVTMTLGRLALWALAVAGLAWAAVRGGIL